VAAAQAADLSVPSLFRALVGTQFTGNPEGWPLTTHPNHYTSHPAYIGRARADGQFDLGRVPQRAMQLIERSLTDLDATVQIAGRMNDILVKVGPATIYARLVEGRFPKWRDVFPQRRDAVKIELIVGPVFSALRQASVVASDESRGIDFVFGAGSLVMTGSSSDFGSARVELPISYDGPSRGVTLDHRYVADFLRVLDVDKQFTVEVEDEESPALFTTDDGYGYVVMPLARRKAGGGAT
jgi:DNA polymerase-3 subunit beta